MIRSAETSAMASWSPKSTRPSMEQNRSAALEDLSQVLPPHARQHESTTPSSAQADARYARYCFLLILLALGGLLSAIPVAQSDWFITLPFGNPFLQNQEGAFRLKHANCDVLIFGDSSAVTGLAPTEIAERTGLKTCNISQPLGVLTVAGTTPLDAYLANNNPPQFLVVAFSPENYVGQLTEWNKVIFTEGVLQLMRHSWNAHAFALLASHPRGALVTLSWIWLQVVDGVYRKFIGGQHPVRFDNGQFTLPVPAQTSCVGNMAEKYIVQDPAAALVHDWTTRLRRSYQRNGTRVLFVSSPVPACTPDIGRIQSAAAAKTDMPPQTFPLNLFNDVDRHFTPAGARRFSDSVAALIRKQPR